MRYLPHGFALLEVLVAVGLLGIIVLYTSISMNKVATTQANQAIANEVAAIYNGMFDMLFRPVLEMKGGTQYQINSSLVALQQAHNILGPESQYVFLYRALAQGAKDAQFYQFFNGGVDVCNAGAAQLKEGPFIACDAIPYPLSMSGITVKGARIDALPIPYFGFSSAVSAQAMAAINNIQPARAVLYLGGLKGNHNFGAFREQMVAIKNTLITSNRIEQNDTSTHVEIYLANFGGAVGQFEYFSGVNRVALDDVVRNKVSNPASYNFDRGEWGAAIVVDFSRASVLRADGSVAIAANQQLCWSFQAGTTAGTSCAKVINQATPTVDAATLYIDSGLAYKSSDMKMSGKEMDRTPVESVMGWFENHNPSRVYMPACPDGFTPKLAVATSSFSSTDIGDFSQEHDQFNSDNNNPARKFYGLIYSWKANAINNPTYWNVSAAVGSDSQSNNGIVNPASVSFIAFRWCERLAP